MLPPANYLFMGDSRDSTADSRIVSQIGYIPAINPIVEAEFRFFTIKGDIPLWQSGSGLQPCAGTECFGAFISEFKKGWRGERSGGTALKPRERQRKTISPACNTRERKLGSDDFNRIIRRGERHKERAQTP